MDNSERLLEVLDDSIRLLKMNYREAQPAKVAQKVESHQSSPIKTKKMMAEEEERAEKER